MPKKCVTLYEAIMARGGTPGLRSRPVTRACREALARGARPEEVLAAVLAAFEPKSPPLRTA